MKTITNRFGELETSWISHKHPENPNFMQVVKYMHIQNKDGKSSLYWSLYNASPNDNHVIRDISLSDAKLKYTDPEKVELTEEEFNKWLNKQETL